MGVGFFGARVPTGIYGPPNMGMGMKTPVLLAEHQTILKTEPSSPPRLRLTFQSKGLVGRCPSILSSPFLPISE